MDLETFKSILRDYGTEIWPGSTDIVEFDLDFALEAALDSLRDRVPKVLSTNEIRVILQKDIPRTIVRHLMGEDWPHDYSDAALCLLIDTLDEHECSMYFIVAMRELSAEELYKIVASPVSRIEELFRSKIP